MHRWARNAAILRPRIHCVRPRLLQVHAWVEGARRRWHSKACVWHSGMHMLREILLRLRVGLMLRLRVLKRPLRARLGTQRPVRRMRLRSVRGGRICTGAIRCKIEVISVDPGTLVLACVWSAAGHACGTLQRVHASQVLRRRASGGHLGCMRMLVCGRRLHARVSLRVALALPRVVRQRSAQRSVNVESAGQMVLVCLSLLRQRAHGPRLVHRSRKSAGLLLPALG